MSLDKGLSNVDKASRCLIEADARAAVEQFDGDQGPGGTAMVEAAMIETLSPALPDNVERLAERVLEEAHAADLMLATAESCTGGLLASLLTDVDGLGHVFDRGFVVYSEQSKCELLGLAPAQIDRCGAVSREVATAMALGALEASAADIAIAITGFAGPGAPKDEPGLVHFGCARKGRDTVHREAHFGDIGRGKVRLACLETALHMLLDALR